MAKLGLFQRLKAGVSAFIKAFKGNTPISKPEKSEELEYIEKREDQYQRSYNKRLEELKDKYNNLFDLAQMKYEALENSGVAEFSSAYQNAGTDFSTSKDVEDMASMFREVARAQTFVKDPTSNMEVVKKETEANGINIYAGRGNGDDSMKAFWSAVNRAKETAGIREKIVQKQYSGAFEYAYKVWQNSEEPDDSTAYVALKTFLDTEGEIRSQDFMTPTALKYEMPEENIDNDFYLK